MTDKEVGDYWNHIQDCPEKYRPLFINLIRKLVEERRQYRQLCCAHAVHDRPENAGGVCNHVNDALSDFGIDPKDYS